MGITACPCCGHTDFFEILRFPASPVSGVLRSSPRDSIPVHELTFEVCAECGLLRNRNFISPPDYSLKARATVGQMPAFQERLLELIGAAAGKNELILEIGSNDGSFLDLLRTVGYTDICGIEPSNELVKTARSKGHRIVENYFGPDVVDTLLADFGLPKVVICRHTLEHVPDPKGFVRALRGLLAPANGVALVEVPDSTAILQGVNFVELWDEHLFYFTPQTLQLIMEQNGLRGSTQLVFDHLETRNLLVQVVPANQEARKEDVSCNVASSEAAVWKEFAHRFGNVTEQIKGAVLTAPRPVYMIGASHPQSNFVNYMDLGEAIDFMIDDDPNKIGRLPPVNSRSIRIISTDDFSREAQTGTLLSTAFGYPDWTRKLSELALSKGIRIVDPRKFA